MPILLLQSDPEFREQYLISYRSSLLQGPAPKRNFTKDDKEGPNLKGIGLSSEEAFEYRRTPAISDTSSQEVGDRLIINEKGSIHITFTKEEVS